MWKPLVYFCLKCFCVFCSIYLSNRHTWIELIAFVSERRIIRAVGEKQTRRFVDVPIFTLCKTFTCYNLIKELFRCFLDRQRCRRELIRSRLVKSPFVAKLSANEERSQVFECRRHIDLRGMLLRVENRPVDFGVHRPVHPCL